MTRPFISSVLGGLAIVLYAYAWLAWSTPAHAAQICGEASFYAEDHHGKTMANGEPFNMHALTAAMWDVPFGTKYRVTSGSKSVIVTITDRGPARRLNRVIDLSKAAAAKLGMLQAGVADVCLARL